jgi:lipoprotein-anchoring transpeptidase ErfK/SrfK
VQKDSGSLWVRGIVLRVSIRFVVTASILAGSALAGSIGGASAQSYYPPPPGYYPPPPYDDDGPPPGGYAPPQSRATMNAPVPPGSVGGSYAAPPSTRSSSSRPSPYGQAYEEPVQDYPQDAYPPQGRTAWQAPAASDGTYYPPRPPEGVRGYGAQDYTGTIHSPAPDHGAAIAALPPEDQPEGGPAQELPQQFHRQLVGYPSSEPAGTIVIDTPHTYLYLVLGGGKALRYGVGVGREGFTWTGTERVSRASEWPDWHPPKEMIERQPYLPRFMAGGEGNPLGARALYLGNTVYRIHGTNQPSTIGHFVSSGCIRLTNEDVEDLYSRVGVGTRVVVLPGAPGAAAAAATPIAR